MDSENNDRKRSESENFGENVKCIILVASTFMSHMLAVGMSFSLGVYYLEFLSEFNKGNGMTSVIGSLNFGALCAAGPLSSFLVPYLGCANIVILGGLIASLGILLCCFSNSIYLVMIAFGLITGVGYGLVFAACITQTSCNITRWRAISNGISISASGLGSVINPILARYLIENYSWRGALMITSAMTLHICVFGFFMRIAENSGKVPVSSHRNVDYAKVRDVSSNGNAPKEAFLESDEDTLPEEKDHVWRNPLFWCLHVNIVLFCFGQSIVFTHVTAFAVSHGFGQHQASSFISVLGIGGFIGRLLLGFLCNLPSINPHILYVVCNGITGLAIICYTFWELYIVMTIMLLIVGLTLAVYGPVLCEVSLEIFGTEGFARGYGFLLLSQAFGTLMGAPAAGQMYDVTKIYNNSFYLGSASLFTASLVYSVGYLIDRQVKIR